MEKLEHPPPHVFATRAHGASRPAAAAVGGRRNLWGNGQKWGLFVSDEGGWRGWGEFTVQG